MKPVSEAPVRYWPALDGIRGLAILAVMAFHAKLGFARGGFLGVDVFFVLSGFLVTSILVRYLAHDGHMQWKTFYSRRARRIATM